MSMSTARTGRTPAVGDAHLIIGGAGFVGCNLADRLLNEGEPVRILDNLSRAGTEKNLEWLQQRHRENLIVEVADVRDRDAVDHAVARAQSVFHFAAQVAVTSSIEDPLYDNSVNVLGTLNVLESIRNSAHRPPLIFTSTNKVYGGLEDVALRVAGERYEPEDETMRRCGVDERRPLAFSSPYGCSKGAADQYVLDYAHSFGLATMVLRMSCIYGPRQFGTEDQGWVAHFVKQALAGEPITLYGDGRQVRDILFIDDLVDALIRARSQLPALRGQAFNMGGGPQRAVSLRELLHRLSALIGHEPEIRYGEWRAADQRYYVSDTSRFEEATGWRARVGVDDGLRRLHEWLASQHAAAPRVAVQERAAR